MISEELPEKIIAAFKTHQMQQSTTHNHIFTCVKCDIKFYNWPDGTLFDWAVLHRHESEKDPYYFCSYFNMKAE